MLNHVELNSSSEKNVHKKSIHHANFENLYTTMHIYPWIWNIVHQFFFYFPLSCPLPFPPHHLEPVQQSTHVIGRRPHVKIDGWHVWEARVRQTRVKIDHVRHVFTTSVYHPVVTVEGEAV